MTEKSYFWDGIAAGDAVLAPYNAEEFNNWMFLSFLSNNTDEAYVIPNYLDTLEVSSTGIGTHSILIKAGAACFNNFLYVLSEAKTLPISLVASSYYRRDLVVLRLDANTNQIRVAVKEGTASTSVFVASPVLTQTAAVYEVPLATIFIDGSLTYINPYFVYDNRKFIYNILTKPLPINLLRNSEWLALSGESVASTFFPDEWQALNAATFVRSTVPEGSGRGDYALGFGSGGAVAQWIKVHGKTFTLKVYAEDASNGIEIGVIGYRASGAVSIVSHLERHYINDAASKEILFTVTFPEDDITTLYVYINEISLSNAIISQTVLSEGYHTGNYRAIPEVIMFTRAVPDASWTATAKSTGATTINFGASFGTLIKNYTRAVILRLRGRDSGSAGAANCYMYAQGYAAPFNALYGLLRLEGVTNDVWRETTAIVPVDQIYYGTGVAGAQLRLYVSATGVGTFDATVEVVGIII